MHPVRFRLYAHHFRWKAQATQFWGTFLQRKSLRVQIKSFTYPLCNKLLGHFKFWSLWSFEITSGCRFLKHQKQARCRDISTDFVSLPMESFNSGLHEKSFYKVLPIAYSGAHGPCIAIQKSPAQHHWKNSLIYCPKEADNLHKLIRASRQPNHILVCKLLPYMVLIQPFWCTVLRSCHNMVALQDSTNMIQLLLAFAHRIVAAW